MTKGMNFIDGQWKPSLSGKTFEQHNPADLTELTGLYQDSTVEDVREAVKGAQRAFAKWRRTPPLERAKFLRQVLRAMESRQEEIAALITAENGKTLEESRAEIRSAIAEMDFQIGRGLQLYGSTVPSARPGVFAYSIRQPLGVVSVICPWNFPWNVPNRKCTPALMAGNTVIFKPASLTPGVGLLFTELCAQADFPPGVISFVTGSGRTVGREMVENPHIKAVSFTGSTAVGQTIQETAAKTATRVQLEMGGKNPAVVLADADLDLAAQACCQAAFACAGQWCTSTSRAIVEESVYDVFLEKIISLSKSLCLGDGRDDSTDVGPVCGQTQMSSILAYIEIGKKEKAKLICGGQRISEGKLERGCFIAPTIFAEVVPDMKIAREEIFGPVLCLMRAQSFEQAVVLANDVDYGLSSSIFTRDISKAMSFVEQTEVGLTHVNIMTAYKEPSMVFGGVKASAAGLPEAGQTGMEFFTDEKVVYIA